MEAGGRHIYEKVTNDVVPLPRQRGTHSLYLLVPLANTDCVGSEGSSWLTQGGMVTAYA